MKLQNLIINTKNSQIMMLANIFNKLWSPKIKENFNNQYQILMLKKVITSRSRSEEMIKKKTICGMSKLQFSSKVSRGLQSKKNLKSCAAQNFEGQFVWHSIVSLKYVIRLTIDQKSCGLLSVENCSFTITI